MTLKQFRKLFYFIDRMFLPTAEVRIGTKWFQQTNCVTLFHVRDNIRYTIEWLDKQQRWELQ